MNLEELKKQIDFIYTLCRNPKEEIVYITTSEHSIGGRAKCGIKGINLGFDWENHQVRIEPEFKLIKLKEGEDNDDLLEENRRLLLELRKAEEMRNCYEHNLQLCTFQERQIGKLADTLKKVMDIIDNGCYPEFEWLKEEYK